MFSYHRVRLGYSGVCLCFALLLLVVTYFSINSKLGHKLRRPVAVVSGRGSNTIPEPGGLIKGQQTSPHPLSTRSLDVESSSSSTHTLPNSWIKHQTTNNADAKAKRKAKIRKLILLTYMRSGSSITGQLLSQSSKVFYVFEPLHAIQRAYMNAENVSFLYKPSISKLDPAQFFDVQSESVDIVKNVLGCALDEVDLATLQQPDMKYSVSTLDYTLCLKDVKYGRSKKHLQDCVKQLKKKCQAASVTLVKVIRLSIDQAQTLIENDPAVGVVHLMRDPRGMFHSQVGQRFGWTDVDKETRSFCGRITSDLRSHEALSRGFPGRSLLVRYEDFIRDPVTAISQVYSLIGLKLTQATALNVLQAAENKDVPFRWRQDIQYEYVKIIERNCNELMEIMGYSQFPNESAMNNLSFSVVRPRFADSLPMKKVKVQSK